jgi:branched-chain amino acid transport system ATP-binding protein
LLKTISGLLSPTSGNISFLGVKTSGMEPHHTVKAGIVLVPEGRQLFPYMTVLDNLGVGCYVKQAREKRDQSLKMVFELFPILEKKRDRLAITMSGGEQQMLAIGRAVMAFPKLLMLDEPSLGLAPILVQTLFDTIQQIYRKQDMSILIVEQNVQTSLSLSHNGYVLENGYIVMKGKSEELLQNEELKTAYMGI